MSLLARKSIHFVAAFISLAAILPACGDDTGQRPVWIGDDPKRDSGADNDAADASDASSTSTETPSDTKPTTQQDAGMPNAMPAANCVPAQSPETVPARSEVISQVAEPAKETVFTRDLFNKFYKQCGGCHAQDAASGGFNVPNLQGFPAAALARQDKIRLRMTSDDPLLYMPPMAFFGKPWSERAADDPVRELYELMDLWLAAGAPTELFYKPTTDVTMMSTESPYLLSAELGSSLTNLGNCIPNKSIVGTAADKMSELDAMFDEANTLPERLDQTDLTSFDSEKLAREGVISIAPAYPLFSDNARKMRHVRVPKGETIKFDKTRQEFVIPANTRFYKTFLKRVIDKQGEERYRKIETRLIVSRPDGPDSMDGSHATHALFGTYAWNEAETEARLVTDPLRNGKPFADRVVTYFTDEGKAQEVLDTQPLRPLVALREAGVTRTYAIPGSERCIQCHMGSHNHSFILGFSPLQVARRPMGEGGIIDEAGDDELTQLQRLIDYKVISGIEKAEDVLPLEHSQGDRAPRNDNELRAQGYMTGNCSHCHNPRGYATVQNPQLRDLLRFFPDSEGGVFQFPLERVSPRIKRGLRQDVSIPYITPSLFDREVKDQDVDSHRKQYTPVNREREVHYQAAPWRSLIYRNTDTPFTYAEDFALFPHMPMNVPGFDCRVPRIMGDWMVSIPARKRTPGLNERFDVDYPHSKEYTGEESPQPYVEVKPTEPDYAEAVREAKRRLDLYHRGGVDTNYFDWVSNQQPVAADRLIQHPRYEDYCPDTSDIVDPTVGISSEAETERLTPDDFSRAPELLMTTDLQSEDINDTLLMNLPDAVPDRPHWVETDVTDPPGDWAPRRPDWSDILVSKKLEGLDARQQTVVSLVQSLKADEAFRTFALGTAPFGIWQAKPTCNFASVPKVKQFSGTDRPSWITKRIAAEVNKTAAEELPVYMQSPGGMVFSEICVNCHGPRFDSRGRQADTLMLMTGGATRVANLRDGLLGPALDPGANRMRVYGQFATDTTTAQDWTARYVAWMGLGGTRRTIPQAILSLVGTSEVLGEKRNGVLPVTDANMLTLAQTLCAHVLGNTGSHVKFDPEAGSISHESRDGTSLVSDNGDADTWLELCSFRNPPPVRIISQSGSALFLIDPLGWYRQYGYPANAPVGNERGEVVNGITPANLAPWCVVPPPDDFTKNLSDEYVAMYRQGKPLPFCPDWWIEDAARTNVLSAKELEAWTLRGAINAGVSVFFYLDQRLRDEQIGKQALPAYDHCEDLNK
ncbi:MAG TPA: hypothetical protein VJV78_30040 [Polyangiales bacterium]|nr:hypothetical protein [Polyangiales bacterium]